MAYSHLLRLKKKLMQTRSTIIILIILLTLSSGESWAQHSVARQWNEVLLEAIRNDFARPTVHARNLFHASVAMYDAWAAYDEQAETFLLGKTVGDYFTEFEEINIPADIKVAQEEAISYAAYRLLSHRFQFSPGAFESQQRFDNLMVALGFDPTIVSTNYVNGTAAELGNHIATSLIQLGLQDGSNEQNDYTNLYYEPVNPPLIPKLPGNTTLVDPNRWQPLTLDLFIDQSGNPIPFNTPEFLSPEWGEVTAFSLKQENLAIYQRDNYDYWVFHDPGPPP